MEGPCCVEDCERGAWCRGWCQKHYFRWYRTGRDPAVPKITAIIDGTKGCSRCEKRKPLDDFSLDGRHPRAICRECDAEVVRANNLRRDYGLSVEDFDSMLERQDGVCAICRQECVTGRRLSVDHCHMSEEVRGLLCQRCNTVLGMAQDDPDRLRTAAEYLEAANGD